jgi:solute carrier family 15 (oligopeptide transporter), member 1
LVEKLLASFFIKFSVFSLIGLIIAIVGVGCIKCNSNTFGANQYKLPEQATQQALYFTLQYFCMKSGSIIGRFFNPILRSDVNCFGMNDCFPLSFGVPAIAMLVSMLIFIAGRSHYIRKPPGGNMFVKVCKCVFVSIHQSLS